MFFDSEAQVSEIAKKVGCAVFVVPDVFKVNIPKAIILEPKEKTIITIEQVREVLAKLSLKQNEDFFVLIRPADKMDISTANALLKNLEEPSEKVHFVLVTDAISKILPTILSRSAIYFLKTEYSDEISADEKTLALAKRLLVAKGADLVTLAEELTKKKDNVRASVLSVLKVTIEMLYKSYYKTGKIAFLLKIPKFLTAYENINSNGHIKLHLVTDLM